MKLSPQMSNYIRECQTGILADVVLGNPKAECCGSGICHIHIGPHTLDSSACKGVSLLAFIRMDEIHSRLLIHFLAERIDEQCIKQHFIDNSLVLVEDFDLPELVTNRLNSTGQLLTIKQGVYPLLDDGVFCTISVRLDFRQQQTEVGLVA
ncbi:MAG: hypothetical protein AAF433_19355 [Bacteroidota bacterium]